MAAKSNGFSQITLYPDERGVSLGQLISTVDLQI
jgi:hypothetical protein